MNHTEPVKNYLHRWYERAVCDYEVRNQTKNLDLCSFVKWIQQFWRMCNKYIELYNSVDLSLGPKMFQTFQLDLQESQYWLINIWNNQICPLLIDIIKEGILVYGTKETNWQDPKQWISRTLPSFLLNDQTILLI